MERKIIVGSRRSRLALTQTEQVLALLRDRAAEQGIRLAFEVRQIVTKGDKILDVALSKVGGKGLFVKEIEQAMLDGEIDMAVHSMKDMPAAFPEELVLAAVPKRANPHDCLISRDGLTLDKLPSGARVGTSSLRREAQLRACRPDLRVVPIRGNIETRMNKIETEGLDAVVLAAAGLQRVGWESRISQILPADVCVPAVGQGALGIQCRRADESLIALLQLINDLETERAVRAERSFLARLNGGCQIPLGAHAVIEAGSSIRMTGFVGTPDGSMLLKETLTAADPDDLGRRLAERLIAQGADRILNETRR
jgi:hydroxymethylbilane synthase